MRTKKCIKCGKVFETARYTQTQCDECLKKSKSSVIRPRTCKICGSVFDGYPRSMYCPQCRVDQEKARAARYRKDGVARHIGSVDYCTICGKEYTVKSGLQKYCPDCAEEAIRAKDREMSKAWNKVNDYYVKRTGVPRSGIKVCVVCGKEFVDKQPSVTCSEECAVLRRKERQRKADAKRSAEKKTQKESTD